MPTSDQPIPRTCWKCSERLPEAYQLNSLEMRFARPPMPGDISICNGCGAFSIFNGLLQLEKPDAIKMRQILATPEIMKMQEAVLERRARTMEGGLPGLSLPPPVSERKPDGNDKGGRA